MAGCVRVSARAERGQGANFSNIGLGISGNPDIVRQINARII
jgi:hypothetical protein